MPEDVNVAQADSTPAPEATPALEVPRSPEDYAKWRMSGELPEPKAAPAKTSKADSTPAKTSSADDKPAEKSAPASEPGIKSGAEKRSAAADRLNELLADLKTAGLTPQELKTFKREAQKAVEPAVEAPKPAPEKTVKPTDAPVKPKLDDFKTWEEYEAAKDTYYEDLADYKAKSAVAASQQQQRIGQKLNEARERYGDTANAAIESAAKQLHQNPDVPAIITSLIEGSPVTMDFLYVMGSKPEEFREFLALAKSNPGAALRKAVLVENLIMEELKGSARAESKTTERGEDGKFKAPAPPEKKETKAPPPPREASGHGSPPPDEVERAIKGNDFTSFRNAQNARDLARRKGQ